MTMSVGKIKDFDVKTGNWSTYVERLEMYFVVNKITDDLKLPTLIAIIGEQAYELLSTLASPSKPSSLSYTVAVDLLRAHLQPTPSILAERYRFRQRRQVAGELIADYVADLKKMARYCEFKTNLEENLRDQFVCGLRSDLIRQRLFAENNIDYNKALQLANTLEAAERDAGAVEGSREQVPDRELSEKMHKLAVRDCSACGANGHSWQNCRYKDFECSYCRKIGHLRRVCMTKEFERHKTSSNSNSNGARGRSRRGRALGPSGRSAEDGGKRRRGAAAAARGTRDRGNAGDAAIDAAGAAHWLCEPAASASSGEEREASGDDEEAMYQMSLAKYRPVCMTVNINDKPLKMEVDTGSALSCISYSTYTKLFRDIPLKTCKLKLKFYDGSAVYPIGYLEINVEYRNKVKRLDLYVINKGSTSLLGRQWLSELCIEIPKLSKCTEVHNIVTSKNNLLNDFISRHEKLFDGTLGKYTGEEVKLYVRPGAQPIYCRARPVPYALFPRVDAELDAMLRAGVIEPVDRSDWATPLVIARKADGGIRLCADYKVTLNKVLLVDRYPVPKVEDLFSGLSGNHYFTKLDLSQAYNQLVLNETSRNYTVINTHRGLFKYNRLVYGLSSSPGIFQKLMTNLFKSIPDVIVFYDDILIKSKSLDSHLKSVEQVFRILEMNGLKIKKEKCEFITDQVKYLGFIINKRGVRVNPEKLKPILDMPHPTNVSELKSFLGMVNFYGKFIKNLNTHINPLYDLLKKGRHWKWTTLHSKVFKTIKNLLCSTEVLTHFDMSSESIVTCDASSRGLGAVLAQRAPGGADGERVVAYASRALTSAEQHYSQIHKEALAIIFAMDKFHQYLFGRKFTLRTDHKPLVTIFGPHSGIPNTAASRLQRWAIKLSAYDFNIEYIRTDKNTADVLSRLISKHKEGVSREELDTPEQTYLHFAAEALLLDSHKLKKETASDNILNRVIRYINDGWPDEVEMRELKPYVNRKNELYLELGCVMWGHRVIIPNSCRDKVITELHEGHMGVVKTKALARSYVWWPGIDEAVEAACRACTICAAVADAPPAHVPRAWPWPDRPWTRIHIDFLGPIVGQTYLIVVDAHSKWIEAIKMSSTTAKAVIKELREMWARFGLPKQVVSDNGPPFFSTEFKQFLSTNGIEQIFSAPYHPASNGAAENAVKICKRNIKKAIKSKTDIHASLCRFLLAYRNTPHYTTGESPAKMCIGRNLRMRLDCLKPDQKQLVKARQKQAEKSAGGTVRQFTSGDEVWFRDYRGYDKWTAGTVVERTGSTDYKVRSINGTEEHRHVDQLKLRVSRDVAKIVTITRNNGDSHPVRERPVKRFRPSLIFPVDNDQQSGTPVGGSNPPASSAAEGASPKPAGNTDIVLTATPLKTSSVPNLQEIDNHDSNDNVPNEPPNIQRVRKPVRRYGIEDRYK